MEKPPRTTPRDLLIETTQEVHVTEKPHKGRIANWIKVGDVIMGDFLDHPYFQQGRTSKVLKHDEATGEVETNNSRYTLLKDPVVVKPRRHPGFMFTGDKVRFLASGGYPYELKEACKVLGPDEVYEVVDCVVHDWSNDIALVGVKGRRFNGVMFEIVERAPDEVAE